VDFFSRKKTKMKPQLNESQLIFSRKVIDLIGFRDNGRAGCDTEYKKRLLLAAPNSIKSINEVLMDAYTHNDNLTKRIPLGGEFRRNYVKTFTDKHNEMKKNKNFYQPFRNII
jgi:hypothetical protein